MPLPLLPLQALDSYFICPRCSHPITNQPDRCESCFLHLEKVNNTPIFVDFEVSVLNREWLLQSSAESPILRPKRGRFIASILAFLHGENKVAEKQMHTFVAVAKKLRERPRVLVVGGATIGSGLRALYDRTDIDLIAFDIYGSPNVQFIADAHRIPMRDQCVEAVIIQAVLEHVIDPSAVVAEIRRILRPGGVLYADTPFLQHVHEGAYDFTRFTESGHRYLFRHFDEISAGSVGGLGTNLLWSVDYFCRGLFRSKTAGRIARNLFFWLRWLDGLIPENYSIDGASGCFFLGTLGDKTITPHELVKRYRGAQ